MAIRKILILVSVLSVVQGLVTSGELYKNHGTMRGAVPFENIQASSLIECAIHCTMNSSHCTCFNYNSANECGLLEAASDGAVVAVAETGYDLYCRSDVDIYLHNYIGCYTDTGDRDVTYNANRPANLTPQVCIDTCRNLNMGFLYAAVQFGIDCFCGTSYGRYGPSTACNMECGGDPAQTCGGFNGNQIYAI